MSRALVDVHELVAWELDEYPYRDAAFAADREGFAKKLQQAQQRLAKRGPYTRPSALLADEAQAIKGLLIAHTQRTDLREEYEGLQWTLGVVDLRQLLAFQRRLVLDPRRSCLPVPQQSDWPQLISLSFAAGRDTVHQVTRHESRDSLDVCLFADNPDLQLRLNPKREQGDDVPLKLYGGSPFLEVAELRGRWFLRDGYHRAYHLLSAGVYRVPAVVICARSMAELGATEPWFFNEDQLFSDRPPQVMDFLDEHMVLRYERVALRRVIRIRIEESLEPLDERNEVQGETK